MNINNYIPVEVPDYVEHISDWKGYRLPNGRCVVDKDICGCGYTEFCLRPENPDNVILCSPRIMLLENKMDQHKNEDNILYFKNSGIRESFANDLGIKVEKIHEHNKEFYQYIANIINNHLLLCSTTGKPSRILCTYDSFHTILDILGERIKYFHVVADEVTALFVDSFFKADVEHAFFSLLQNLPNVIYLSATPDLENYVDDIEDFKYLPYYKLIWPKSKVTTAIAYERWVNDVFGEVLNIINIYKNKPLDRPWKKLPDGRVVRSNEVVIYVNSVRMIRDLISKAKLDPSECNILCSNTPKNRKTIRKVRNNALPKGVHFEIGEIPLKGEPHKMFTFCTRTVYLGADFYSTNATTVIASDANIDSLVVDIRVDLPQILGRQRLKENPWKNECIIFYCTTNDKGEKATEEDFFKRMNTKTLGTQNIYENYMSRPEDEKRLIEESYFFNTIHHKPTEDLEAGSRSYYLSLDYNKHLVINPFLKTAEKRAWELTQKDYLNNITVLRSIAETEHVEAVHYTSANDERVQMVIDQIKEIPQFDVKLRLYCEVREKFKDDQNFTDKLLAYYTGTDLENLYSYFGYDQCRAVGFRAIYLKRKISDQVQLDPLKAEVYNVFKVKEKYTLKYIKETLGSIYQKLGIFKSPKASDLEEFFNTKRIKVPDKTDNKLYHGYQLISIK